MKGGGGSGEISFSFSFSTRTPCTAPRMLCSVNDTQVAHELARVALFLKKKVFESMNPLVLFLRLW
jgi:hypothetical protein